MVLEWDKDDLEGEYARVLTTDVDHKTANWYLEICPEKFTREVVTMDTYRLLRAETVE